MCLIGLGELIWIPGINFVLVKFAPPWFFRTGKHDMALSYTFPELPDNDQDIFSSENYSLG